MPAPSFAPIERGFWTSVAAGTCPLTLWSAGRWKTDFPERIIKSVFGSTYRALGPFEKLSDAQPHWGKGMNWKAAAAMTMDDIATTDLGDFLNNL